MSEDVDDGVSNPPSLEEKVSFLSSPETHGGDTVDVRETHMAFVFLAGSRAYKLKKPLRAPLLDYSTVAARARACVEELRLNRRLAPDVYLETPRLTRSRSGAMGIDGEGQTIDWLILMERLPESRMLDQLILKGTIAKAEIERLGMKLADFYHDCPREKVDAEEHSARCARELEMNREVFAEFGALGERGQGVTAALLKALQESPEVLTERVAEQRLLEGHGDLRPEHVCLRRPIAIIDCLEFSRELRIIDPFDEICFLSMECAVLGARWVGRELIDICARQLADRPSSRQLGFYTAYRAGLRARQMLAHCLEPIVRTPDKWVPLARRYIDEAEGACALLLANSPEGMKECGPGNTLEAETHSSSTSRGQAKTASAGESTSHSSGAERRCDSSPLERQRGSRLDGSMRIFALGDSAELAAKVARLLGLSLSDHEIRVFDDGECKLRPLVGVRGADVYVMQALIGGERASVNDRLQQILLFLGACREHGAASVKAVLPYLAYARKDRQTQERDPVSSRYMAQIMEAVGTDMVVALDVHNISAFQNAFRCPTVHLEARSLFAARMPGLADGLPVTVLSPDSGGVKRAELLRRSYEEVTARPASLAIIEKHRGGGRLAGDLFAGDVEGAAVFIFDDMISSGSTMLRAADACRRRGAKKIVAMATHGLFSGQDVRGIFEHSAVDHVIVTDSLPTQSRLSDGFNIERFETLSVASLLAESLEQLHLAPEMRARRD